MVRDSGRNAAWRTAASRTRKRRTRVCRRDRARGGRGRAARERGESTERALRGSRARVARLRARNNHPGLATRAAIAGPRRVASWNRRPLRPTEVVRARGDPGAMLSSPSTLSTGRAPCARQRPADSVNALVTGRGGDPAHARALVPVPIPRSGALIRVEEARKQKPSGVARFDRVLART